MVQIMRDLRANQHKSQPERDGIAKFAETESRFPRRKARHVKVDMKSARRGWGLLGGVAAKDPRSLRQN